MNASKPEKKQTPTPSSWTPQQWRTFPIRQVPTYDNSKALGEVEKQLASFPPLVFPFEAQHLTGDLSQAEKGQAFILQGGPCAENFSDFSEKALTKTFETLFQMACIINFQAQTPVVKIGRMAGQMAKPRSSDTQTKGDVTLPSYRGDIINDNDFSRESRIPSPQRMLRGYFHSAGVLNLLRGLSCNGYQHLLTMQRQFLDDGQRTAFKEKYHAIARDIETALTYLRACGMDPAHTQQINDIRFYTSHEALLLPYEEALTRRADPTHHWYDLSAHLLWIGDRTRQPDGAHVAFMKGIHNPVGVKIGPTMTVSEFKQILHTLNPHNHFGRLVLICRMGSDKIQDKLPPLLEAFKEEGIKASWISDPMHGNTLSTKDKLKTRPFDRIREEIEQFFKLCTEHKVQASGVHLEMTGENVTECIGGSQGLNESDLTRHYTTSCDPRLNGEQSLELAFSIAQAYKAHQRGLGFRHD